MCQPEVIKSALTQAVVSLHEPVATGMWRMVLSVPRWQGDNPLPGQFLMLRVADDSEPLLARPFGISGFDKKEEGAELEIIYRVVGRGTRIMERWLPGQQTAFLGPLGKEFSLPPEGSSSLLVAGGVGLPPLLAMARKMEKLGRARELTLVYGEASRDRLIDLVSGLFPDVDTATCTEDGSCGTQGLVTNLLEARGNGDGRHLFVCGPNPMMKAVMEITAERCLSAQYSLEARMACGFGVCSGCAVKLASGDYVRVCREGPVFKGSELSADSFGAV
jgi:dihydroorotate dehydrogenase electron transfer subunit